MTVLWLHRRGSGVRSGSLIGGRYRLGQVIGSGSFGTVWRADDTEQPGRSVALKQSRPIDGGPDSARRRERALREGDNTGRLVDEAHVVAVYDSFEEYRHVWLVAEYLDSLSLDQLMSERGRLESPEVAWIGHQVAEALAAVHAESIVHRDVAPANVLVSRGGEVAKLTDFGVARNPDPAPYGTVEGAVVGHPAYLSPEEAHGAPASPESDVFSLGSVLYHAVEGRPPFGDGADSQLLDRIRAGRLDPPQHAADGLGALLVQMLQIHPQSRPTADDVAERLHEMDGTLDAATRATLSEHQPPVQLDDSSRRTGPLRRPVLVGVLCASGVLAVVGVVLAMVVFPGASTVTYGVYRSVDPDDLRLGPPSVLRPTSDQPKGYEQIAVLGRGPAVEPDAEVPGTHLIFNYFCTGEGSPEPCGGVLRSHYLTASPTAPTGLWPSTSRPIPPKVRLYDAAQDGRCADGQVPVFRYETSQPGGPRLYRPATTSPGVGWTIGENLGCLVPQ